MPGSAPQQPLLWPGAFLTQGVMAAPPSLAASSGIPLPNGAPAGTPDGAVGFAGQRRLDFSTPAGRPCTHAVALCAPFLQGWLRDE